MGKNRTKREARKTDKKHRFANLANRKWELCKSLFAPLGLDKDFQSLPERIRERMWRGIWLGPIIEFDASIDPMHNIRDAVHKRLDDAKVTINGADLPLLPALTILGPLVGGLSNLPDGTTGPILSKARTICKENLWTVINTALDKLGWELGKLVIEHSKFDRELIWFDRDFLTDANGRKSLQLIFGAEAPARISALVDGKPRPAFRCGCTVDYEDSKEVDWVNVPAGSFGGDNGQAQLPVFVQSHAIARLHERLPLPNRFRGHVESWVAWSVQQPPARSVGDSYHVPFLVSGEYRCGYLILRRMENMVLVQTFLFLTMGGTPEANRLYTKMGLARQDIQELDLDKFMTFVEGSVHSDPEMAARLTECGCGDLVRLGRLLYDNPSESALAAKLRRYMRLEPKKCAAATKQAVISSSFGSGQTVIQSSQAI